MYHFSENCKLFQEILITVPGISAFGCWIVQDTANKPSFFSSIFTFYRGKLGIKISESSSPQQVVEKPRKESKTLKRKLLQKWLELKQLMPKHLLETLYQWVTNQ